MTNTLFHNIVRMFLRMPLFKYCIRIANLSLAA